MNNNSNNFKPIEVDFYDVPENSNVQDININKVVKSHKLPFKLVVAALQKKAKAIIDNKARVIELVTKALAFCKKLGNISFLKNGLLMFLPSATCLLTQ